MRRSRAILRNHHIISQQFESHPAFDGIDKQALGVQAQRNQIYLPAGYELARNMGVSPHPGGHVPLYYKAVARTLDKLATIADPDLRAAEIATLIDAMRAGLVNGDLYTNVPTGKTIEEVNRGIERVIDNYTTYRASALDRVQAIRELEQKGAKAGYDHLGRWSAILGNATREKLLSEAIRDNPRLNVTSGNKDLAGTPWQQKFVATDDNFRVPGSEPIDPNHVPQSPGFIPSPLPEFAPEGFTRSDPRLTHGLSGFPAASPDWQRFGQVPPSTAAPPEDQVLQYDMPTGLIYALPTGSAGSAGLARPSSSTSGSSLAPWLVGAAALGTAALFFPAWFVAALGLAAVTGAANGRGLESGSANRADVSDGSVFANGVSSLGSLNQESIPGIGRPSNGPMTGPPPLLSPSEPESGRIDNFAERFGNWPGIPNGTMSAQPTGVPDATNPSAAEATAPDEVRRLTRVNASNAGSVFDSGSAPVPYLASPEFDNRFGNWQEEGRRPRQVSSPVGTFADEPSYAIPPPIWGSGASANPRNDAEEWFSRWIQPLPRQD